MIESTKGNVSNVKAIKSILDSYWTEFEPIVVPNEGAESGSITISGHDSWPSALHISEWPDSEEHTDDQDWDDAMSDLLEEKGEEGFLALLRDLAPYLETPLTIVWCDIFEGDFWGAAQWTVCPGSPDVEVQRVDPLPTTVPSQGPTTRHGTVAPLS
jgi:hypothetical protein